MSVLSACATVVAGVPVADPDAKAPAGASSGPVTLRVATFGEFGLADLLDEYQEQHPDVTVKHDQTQDGASYYDKLLTRLAAGDVPDVVLIEDSRLPEFSARGVLHDLEKIGPADVTPKRWLDWKYEAGVAADGTWVGYGLDAAPMAMVYRTDLFAAAGLPTAPDQVSSLFESWDAYFAAGDQYVQATGKPWFDSSAQIFNAMHNQRETGFFDEDGKLVIETDPDIKATWDQVMAALGQSAKLRTFTPEWMGGLRSGAFATMPAPYWMLGLMEHESGGENAGKWATTTVFPGGGGNWGGSFLAVPRQSEHPEEAAALAAWLTAPEQQLAAFRSAGTFPSQVEALESDTLLGTTNEYFTGGKTGEVYAKLAAEVPVTQPRAPRDSVVEQEALGPALQAAEAGTPPDQAWQQAVSSAKQIAGR